MGGVPDIDGPAFSRRFRALIALSWALPPIFGLGFLFGIVELFTLDELGSLFLSPPLPMYIVATQLFADTYFKRFAQPIVDYLDAPNASTEARALARARRFPLHFWCAFLSYLILAPVAVLSSANLAYGFVPRPVDWFRTELTSLVVSIIVGLPIFFLVIDLYGRTFRNVALETPHVRLTAKVFLIAALVPLLIDTMLVQYYWTATGYFTWGTFLVWLVLELLAIAGALMMVRSLRQSLRPLEVTMGQPAERVDFESLRPESTDELGVLSSGYRALLEGLKQHGDFLERRNELLNRARGLDLSELVPLVGEVIRSAVGAELALVARLDPETNELVPFAATRGSSGDGTRPRVGRAARSVLWSAIDDPSCVLASSEETADDAVTDLRSHAVAVAPLMAEGRASGVLAIVAAPSRPWRAGQRGLLEALAAESGRLLHAAELRARQSELESQLLHAQRLETVGRLAGGVAHDFNNILTAIIGTATLLQMEDDSSTRNEGLEDILEASMRASILTRQLLAFSRRQLLDPNVLDLNEVVHDMERMLRRLVPSTIDLELDLEDGLWRVFADHAQMEQVLVNLIVNAKDAISGQGRIRLRTRNRQGDRSSSSPEDRVVLEVEDDGAGISAENIDRIFDPYFTTKEAGKGTGLGLATVYGIVSQSGGIIVAEPGRERGARFELSFPRSFQTPTQPPVRRAAPTDHRRLQGHTALVVEDDGPLRQVVVETLEKAGLQVLSVERGDEAIAVVDGHSGPIHILLCDVIMPGSRGTDVARHVKAARPDISILLMSGYVDTETLDEILRAGFPFIAKPFTPEELTARLAEVLVGEAPRPKTDAEDVQ